jgi:2-methylfumaryl-CoA isomerase
MFALEQRTGRDLANEGDRFQLRTEIASLVGGWVGGKTLDEIRAAFEAHSVLWGPYRTVRDLVTSDPRVAPEVNPVWGLVDQPGIGSYPAPGHPLRFGAGLDRPALPAPEPGSDTESVLAEVLGMSIPEISALAARGVL